MRRPGLAALIAVAGWLATSIAASNSVDQLIAVTGKADGMLGTGRVSPDGRFISCADDVETIGRIRGFQST